VLGEANSSMSIDEDANPRCSEIAPLLSHPPPLSNEEHL
jgi:hypothetical protein